MPETFPDGFPMTPAEAIEYSYFFSESEKQDWREWLTTASNQEQAELVDMLHKIWLDKQKQAVPDQFTNSNPNFNQPQQAQDFNYANTNPVNNFIPESDFYENQTPKQESFATEPTPQTNQQPNGYPDFNFEPQPSSDLGQDANLSTDPSANSASTFENVDEVPEFSFDNIPNATQNTEAATNQIDNASISQVEDPELKPEITKPEEETEDDFDFNFDDTISDDSADEPQVEPQANVQSKPLVTSQPQNQNSGSQNEQSTESDDFYKEQEKNLDQVVTPNQDHDIFAEETTQPTQITVEHKINPGFSISKIREGVTSQELDELYQNYLNNRSGIAVSKRDHDQSYDELMRKVISIVLNFETVGDYLEFMISKLSQMNETIIKQAEEIATFKNGQNNHAHDLEQNLNQVLSKIETIEKNQNLDFEQYRTRLDSLEIKHTGQNNSAYSEYEDLNTQIDLLKSKLIMLEKEFAKELNQKQNTSPKLATTIPVPKNTYQSHLPLSQKLKDFTANAGEHKDINI